MTLGENLQRLRREKGLSQEDVAQKLFVSRQSVSKWELSQAEPGVEYLKALAGLYGVTLDELTGRVPPVPPGTPPPEQLPAGDEPDPEEEERSVRWYRTLFAIRTATVILANLVSIAGGRIDFPFDWIALVVGLFVRNGAVYWTARILICVNLVLAVVCLFINPIGALVTLAVSAGMLWAFTREELRVYFHMPRL